MSLVLRISLTSLQVTEFFSGSLRGKLVEEEQRKDRGRKRKPGEETKTIILNFGFKKTNSITNLLNIDWTSNLRIGKIQT